MYYLGGRIGWHFDLFRILEDTMLCKKDANFHLETMQESPSLCSFLLHYLFTQSFATRKVRRPFYLFFNIWPKEGVVVASYFAYINDISIIRLIARKSERGEVIPFMIPPLFEHERALPFMTNHYKDGERISYSILSPSGDITFYGMGVVATPFWLVNHLFATISELIVGDLLGPLLAYKESIIYIYMK